MATRSTSTVRKSFFEQQRDALVGEIAVSLEQVLQNINKLNRSLEGVIAVGNEFGSVEALWSQFEGVMARDPEVDEAEEASADDDAADQTQNAEGDTTVRG
ncbi:MAG: hypothetical protein M1817_005543 [Caeruleum heppii]|nr:MAG: hypothetical protein M1817_005543 [Caeruleum heppii]